MHKEYTQYMNQLEGSYKEYFHQVENIISEYKLTDEESDNAMSELLDMVLCAQEDHKSCDDIFGTNVKSFCKDYIHSLFPYHLSTNVFASIIAFASMFILFGFGTAFLERVDGTIQNLIYDKINILHLLVFVLCILFIEIIAVYNRKKTYLQSSRNHKIQRILIIAVTVGMSSIIGVIFDLNDITFMVCMGDIWPILATVIILGFSGLVTVKMLEGNNSNIDESALKAIRKEYKKKNLKKGWSEQQFINKYRKFYTFWYPIIIFEFIILMVFLLAALTLSIIHTGVIAIFGIVLMLVFEVFISTAIITAGIRSKRIVHRLMVGSIKLGSGID